MGDIRRFPPSPPWFVMAIGAIGAVSGWLCLGRLAEPLGLRSGGDVGAGGLGALLYGSVYVMAAYIDQQRAGRSGGRIPTAIRVLLIALVTSLMLALTYDGAWLHLRLARWAAPALAEAGLVWLFSLPALCLVVQCMGESQERLGSWSQGWMRARVAQTVIAVGLTAPWWLAPNRTAAALAVGCLMVASLPLAMEALARLSQLRALVPLVSAASHAEPLPYLSEPDLDYGFGQRCERHLLVQRHAYRQPPRSFTCKGEPEQVRHRLAKLLHWSAALLLLGALQLIVLAYAG